jgi:hypothetical protein
MRRGIVAFSALALVGAGLTACGRSPFEQREPWRTEAEEACLARKLVQPSAYMSRASAIDGPGACGISYPFKISAFAGGEVALTSKVTLGCPVIPKIDAWLAEVVQPAASLYFGMPVSDIRAGSYSCRPRNNQRGAKLSEHSFGNALDVMSFKLASGREVTVVKGWRGAPDEQEFLREVFVGACRHFNTVLGPGADMFHYDHFHLDLARHDPRGLRRVCKPILKFTPRINEAGQAIQSPRLPPPQPYEPDPIDMEEDADPFAVSAARPAVRTPPSNPYASRPAAPVYAAPASPLPAAPPRSSTAAIAPAAPVTAYRPGYNSLPPGPASARGPSAPVVLQPHLWTEQDIY